tara:strand:- start:286 stop:1557 length:1272 start_codon:yes stop_codon:yes gene_type:complete
MFPLNRTILCSGDVFRDEFSLAFDGTNDYIDLSRTFNYNVHSISIWLKETATSGQSTIFDHRDGNNDGINFYLTAGQPIYAVNDVDAHYTTSIGLNQWTHIVLTNDGSTSTIYVNGVSVETADTSGETINISSSANARFARDNTGNYFTGNLSEAAIYNKALSASEVKTLYNGREPYNHKEGVCSSNLQAWYRMGDGLLDGNRTFSHTQSNDDSTQDNIISDESNSGLGPELYTFSNALSTSAHESTNITTDGASTYTNGFRAFTGTTVELESSITNSSSHALKYTTNSGSEGFRVDLSNHVSDSGTGLDVGSVYQISVDARHIGTGDGNAVHSIRIAENSGMGTSGETLVLFNISKTMTTYRNYKAYFIYNGTTTRYFGAREANSDSDSGGLYIDNLSIKKVNGHAGIMNNFSFAAIKGDTP